MTSSTYCWTVSTRAETAAATRRALLDAAEVLLDAGGPDAVTLREVGARAGVSRSAPYRHFADKESLLMAIAAGGWNELGDSLQMIASMDTVAESRLRRALIALVSVGRRRPHLYRLMFATPSGDPAAAVRAALHTQELFVHIVAGVVGDERAWSYAGMLLTSAHGVTDLELSGHLVEDKWPRAEAVVDLLIGLLPEAAHAAENG
jgi:AcrR family transcriptional regulator